MDKVLYSVSDIDIDKLINVHIGETWDKKYIIDEYHKIKDNKNFGIRI